LYIFGIKQFIFNASSLGSDEYINDGKDLLARARKDRSRKLKVAMKFDEEKLSKLSEKTRNAILNQNKKKSVSDKIENNDLSKFLGKKNITIDVEDDDSDRSENTN
jgi:predicted Rossmann fold nucleotide-binding protein DprA/Smf involved in DNA uptake